MTEIKEIKEALDLQHQAWHEFKKINDERLEKIEENQSISELEEKLEKMQDDLNKADELKSKVEVLETSIKRNISFNTDEEPPDIVEKRAAYIEFLKTGFIPEKKDLSVSRDPDGGFLVTPDINGRMAKQIFESSPIRSVASIQQISTDSLEGVYDDNEASAGWVGETSGRPTTSTPQVGSYKIPVHEMYALLIATQKLIDDVNFDIEAWIQEKGSTKFARIESTAFISGDGADKPRGFLNYPASTVADQYERGAVGQVVGSGSSGQLNFDDIYNLSYALKAEYRANSRFAMNRSTFAAVRKLKDNDGRYLWEPNNQVGQPATLNGIPTIEFNDMPDVASNSLSIALADWARAYQIVDRVAFSVLRDPYTNKGNVEFYMRRRVGGQVIEFDAIKLLKTAT